MFRVFAVDPDTVAQSWDVFRTTAGRFSAEQGRLIADYPSKQGGQPWESVVWSKAKRNELSQGDLKRIGAKLQQLRRATAPVSNRFVRTRAWIDNVKDSHALTPWQAVLSDHPDCDLPVTLRSDDIEEDDGLFYVAHDCVVERDGNTIVPLVRPLLLASRRLVIVDPHFMDTALNRWTGIISGLVRQARQGPVPLAEAVIHTSVGRDRYGEIRHENGEYRERVRGALARYLPANATVTVKRWDRALDPDAMHPRYILTDIGGVRIDWGMDEREGGSTDVCRLTAATWTHRLDEFDKAEGRPFDRFDVIGTSG